MAGAKVPESSTVRSALAAVGAVDDLLRPGRDGCVLDADTAVAALVVLIEEVRALRPHQARDVVDHLEARLAAGALSPRTQAIRVRSAGIFPLDPDYWPVPLTDQSDDHDDPTPDVEPTTAEGTDDDLADDAGDLPDTLLYEPPPEPATDHDQWDDDGKRERATAAVDELAARVNEGGQA